jgi:hypothetical protein
MINMTKNTLIKGSGDVTEKKEFVDFINEKTRDSYVVVIPGAGTKISTTLRESGYEVAFDDFGRRIMNTREERLIMELVLEEEVRRLQTIFSPQRMLVKVIPSFLFAGPVIVPINGDDLVKAYDLGFDEKYVFTTQDRVEKKKQIFKDYPTVTIVGI